MRLRDWELAFRLTRTVLAMLLLAFQFPVSMWFARVNRSLFGPILGGGLSRDSTDYNAVGGVFVGVSLCVATFTWTVFASTPTRTSSVVFVAFYGAVVAFSSTGLFVFGRRLADRVTRRGASERSPRLFWRTFHRVLYPVLAVAGVFTGGFVILRALAIV